MKLNKIKIILVIGLLGYWVIGSAGCAKKTEIKNIDSRGKSVVCFGDSITFGYGANPGEDYPSLLSKILSDAPVINAGVDGDTTVEALKRLNSDVLDKDPLLVIVEFGGNDFLKKIGKAETINNVREIVERIQAKGAMVAVIDISAGMLLREYTNDLHNIAQDKGAIFIPAILNGIITNSHYKSDFIHPNAEGYKIIAQRVYRYIIPHLNQNTINKEFGK